MRLDSADLLFIMIDIQSKFLPHIADIDAIIKNSSILNRAAELLSIPLLVTEQNPVGLGKTIEDIYLPKKSDKMVKARFSIFEPDIENIIESTKKSTLVLYGIEAHICVLQSFLEAREKGYKPVIVEDAVSSISAADKMTALNRIRQSGGEIVSTQMLLFEILEDTNNPAFRDISRLIKHGIRNTTPSGSP
jgi:hypothetical protein